MAWNGLAAAVVALALVFGLIAPSESPDAGEVVPQYCAGRAIDADAQAGRAVQLARRWQTVLEERFEPWPGGWRVKNYQNALRLAVEPHAGRQGLRVTRQDKKTDTAFELASAPVAVAAGSDCKLRFWASHDVDLRTARGHKEDYWSQIRWLGPGGQPVGETPFEWDDRNEDWHEHVVSAKVPEGAVAAVVRLGFDSPDLYESRYLRLADLSLAVRTEPPAFESEGELVSRPVRLDGAGQTVTLAWQAETPAGTAVAFELRSAPDEGGGPGTWTDFQRWAGGSAGIQPGHVWFQYRARLSTQAPAATPVLKEARLKRGEREVVDRAWPAPDTTPPILVQHSPGRTQDPQTPITFALTDNAGGVGLDPRSVQAFLDGQSITGHLRRQADGSFVCTPPTPLKPYTGLARLDGWGVRNYNQAFTIRPAGPRAPGGLEAILLTRQGAKQDTAFCLTSPRVSVQEGASYEVSFWSRHTLALGKAGAKTGSWWSGVMWLDADGKPLGEHTPFDLGAANPEWHQDKLRLTAPPGARWAVMSFGWDWPDLFDGAQVAFADPEFNGPHPERPGHANLHRVTISTRDLAGNEMRRDWWILVKEPPKTGIVTVRDDGVTLVDGKPFFPIGLYSVWKREHNQNDFGKCFAELAEAGFNTAHTYNAQRGADLAEFYESAHKHGLKVFLACSAGANNRNAQTAVADVAVECNQPALLAWYLADDTASHITPADLRAVHDAIKAIDPYHITVQADGVGKPHKSRYAAYVDATDGFLPELYPIRSDADDEVARIIQDMKTIATDLGRAVPAKSKIENPKSKIGTPVWAIIQDFQGWGWKRYPTDAEVRCMTYLAIIHGATGMTYYTYGGHGENHGATHDPEVWSNLKRIAGELAKLHDVLVERDPPQTQKVEILSGKPQDGLGYPSISTRLKQHGGKLYLLAANSAEAAVRAKLTAPSVREQVDVLFEGRLAKARDGAFEDDFAPYAVHVYVWTKD